MICKIYLSKAIKKKVIKERAISNRLAQGRPSCGDGIWTEARIKEGVSNTMIKEESSSRR